MKVFYILKLFPWIFFLLISMILRIIWIFEWSFFSRSFPHHSNLFNNIYKFVGDIKKSSCPTVIKEFICWVILLLKSDVSPIYILSHISHVILYPSLYVQRSSSPVVKNVLQYVGHILNQVNNSFYRQLFKFQNVKLEKAFGSLCSLKFFIKLSLLYIVHRFILF